MAIKKKTPVELIENAKKFIILDYGFFATLLYRMKTIEEGQNSHITTMATNGEHLYFSPKFVQQCTMGELLFCICHEVMHCAMGHLWRRGNRNPTLWNYATDFVINLIVTEISSAYKMNNKSRLFVRMERPSDCLYNEAYRNMSAEQVYKLLEEKGENACKKEYGDITNHVKWEDKKENSNSKDKKTQDMWESALTEAWTGVKDCGSMSGTLSSYMKNFLNPQKNWKTLLQEFVQEEVNDYSWLPPDKRMDGDFFLCDYNDTEENVKDLLFFIDTSGSMSMQEIKVCFSEIQGAVHQFNGKLQGTMFFFDYYVNEKYYDIGTYSGRFDEIKFCGGGGTSFKCIFDYINSHRDIFTDISGVIVLTDGYCDYPNERDVQGLSVLWLLTNEHANSAPFGKTTRVIINQD